MICDLNGSLGSRQFLNVVTCPFIYIGETGRRLGDRFREHLRDIEKDDKKASKLSLDTLICRIILSNIWQSAASPYIKEAQKAVKLLNKNLFFESVLLILTVSTNAFHSTNSFCCFSRCQAPTNSVAPYFCI